MSEPLVCAVILTKDRPEMVQRAIKSFCEQTYENKNVVVLNSGSALPFEGYPANWMAPRGCSIGHYRNMAIDKTEAEIIIHFDDDDMSHPNRIAEQVAHLQASGADVVGYNELLFWREAGIGVDKDGTSRGCPVCGTMPCSCTAQAWLYRNTRPDRSPGTSLCYWRRTWERKPFPDLSIGEDTHWLTGLNVAAESAMIPRPDDPVVEPRLIASIHGGNTAKAGYDIETAIAQGGEKNWIRTPDWDDYCRKVMAL